MTAHGWGWRWVAPDGKRVGVTRARKAEAIVEGVQAAAGKRNHALTSELVLQLWASLERAGWRVEEHRP